MIAECLATNGAIVLMNRQASEAVTLSDGTRLPKGCIIGIPTYPMRDAENYKNPDKFDGSRFLRMRQEPGMETRGQFVTTSADHIGFGHGKQLKMFLLLSIANKSLKGNAPAPVVCLLAMRSRSR